MPDPVATLARQLASRAGELTGRELPFVCGGAHHRLVVTADAVGLSPVDHDLEAEAVVAAVGGTPPPCLEVTTAAASATVPMLWSALLTATGALAGAGAGAAPPATPAAQRLRHLPPDLLRLLLARRVHDEFAGAGSAARASVSRTCLSVLNDDAAPEAPIRTRFSMLAEFPRWHTGDRAWSDKELVLLARMFRASHGTVGGRPQLQAVPTETVARTTLARYLVDLLDDHRVLRRPDLSAALAPTHPNIAALIRLLVAERLLEPVDGGYRTTAARAPRPTATPAGRRRPGTGGGGRRRRSAHRR